MKSLLVLWGLAALALVMQGAFATIVPAYLCPDLAIVMVLCVAMQWEGFASGSAAAAVLGFAADLLSGAFLGAHALLYLLVFATGQVLSRQLNLRSALSLMTTGASAVLLGGVFLSILAGGVGGELARLGETGRDLLIRAGVTAVVTPSIFVAVRALAAQLADEESGPRSQRLARPGRVP